jgi:hypothetical protein
MAAEEAAPPQLLVVEHATVDPAEVGEFEAWFKDWVAAFQGSGLGADYNWYTSSGPGFDYVWVSPISDYSVLGAREAQQKEIGEALGEEKIAQLFSKMHLMKSHSRELLRMRPELSYAGKADADLAPGFIRIETHYVRPGMEEPYEALVKRVVEIVAKADQPHGWDGYVVEFGKTSYVYTSIASTAAEYFQRPTVPQILTKALGEEGAGKILSEWRECISQLDQRDARVRPELSFVAAPAGE